MVQRPSSRSPAAMKYEDHRKLWRMVEGAVYDALRAHPDYLTDRGAKLAASSITKRVVGQLVGHAIEARKRRPFGAYTEERDRGITAHGLSGASSLPSGKTEGAPAARYFNAAGVSCARSRD